MNIRFKSLLRYKLRTLMAVLTLGCCVMGIIANCRIQAQRQKEAWDVAESLGGTVLTNAAIHPSRSAMMRGILGDDSYVGANAIWLERSELSDNHLVFIARLPHIQLLAMQGTHIGNNGMRCISRLTEMQCLYVGHTKVTDVGLRDIKGMVELRELQLDGTSVGDIGLGELSCLPNLQILRLEDTQVTDVGLMHLQHCKSLKKVFLGGSQVTSAGVRRFRLTRPDVDVTLSKVRQ